MEDGRLAMTHKTLEKTPTPIYTWSQATQTLPNHYKPHTNTTKPWSRLPKRKHVVVVRWPCHHNLTVCTPAISNQQTSWVRHMTVTVTVRKNDLLSTTRWHEFGSDNSKVYVAKQRKSAQHRIKQFPSLSPAYQDNLPRVHTPEQHDAPVRPPVRRQASSIAAGASDPDREGVVVLPTGDRPQSHSQATRVPISTGCFRSAAGQDACCVACTISWFDKTTRSIVRRLETR